jgi:excisionase family DNA binding protein
MSTDFLEEHMADRAERQSDAAGPYIAVREAAHLLRLSEVSVRRFLTEKRLKRYKAAGRTLLRRDEVLALVKPATN